MALSWSGIDLGRWIEFGSPRETDFGSRVWSDYLIIRVDGDHNEVSSENPHVSSVI